MLSDGNGEFAKAIGLTMDASKHGMGTRGQRYSMIVNDGRVEQLNIEEPGAFNVSSPDYMLERLYDRKSVVSGKSVSVCVDLGGRRIINKKIIADRDTRH